MFCVWPTGVKPSSLHPPGMAGAAASPAAAGREWAGGQEGPLLYDLALGVWQELAK